MPEATFKPAEAAAIDTYIDEENPAVNYGVDARLILEINVDGWNLDCLFKFDLSTIPPGSQIEAAVLSLYLDDAGNLEEDVVITRILAGNLDWTEGGCTWNTKDGVNAWAGTAGCETRGADIAGADLFNGTATIVGASYNDFDLDPVDFQALIDVGNYGFKLWGSVREPVVTRHNFYTSSTGAEAKRPKLYVRWVEPSVRLVRYSIDVWDTNENIIDNQGEIVEPDRVNANEWIRLIGAGKPSSKVYDDLIADPNVSFIESVSYRMDSDKVNIKANKESMIQSFLKRLGGMTS